MILGRVYRLPERFGLNEMIIVIGGLNVKVGSHSEPRGMGRFKFTVNGSAYFWRAEGKQ